jgi:hypothetical protein
MKCQLLSSIRKALFSQTTNEKLPVFGEEHANALFKAGWAQCQIFRPTADLPHSEENVFFVVCTQSCTVVSPDLSRDPFVEIAEGRPLPTFRAKSHQARGKDVTKFHLPVDGADFEALEININSRKFVRRELLIATRPAGFTVSNRSRRDFAAWIARYYSRIALPTELVRRLRLTILKKLEQFLAAKTGIPPEARHDQIASIWIRFEPDTELANGIAYEVKLLLICDKPEIAEKYDRELLQLFGGQALAIDNIEFSFDVNSLDETRLSDLTGWQRFTDWDYLSGMVAAISTPGS